jgi:hypothetical protein
MKAVVRSDAISMEHSSKTTYYCVSISIDGNLELELIVFLFSYHIVDCSYGAISHFIHLVIFKGV